MSKMQNAIPEADRPKLNREDLLTYVAIKTVEWVKDLRVKDLIVDDATGANLKPGDPEHCEGNGFHLNVDGDAIECCCDECDYLQLCFPEENETNEEVE